MLAFMARYFGDLKVEELPVPFVAVDHRSAHRPRGLAAGGAARRDSAHRDLAARRVHAGAPGAPMAGRRRLGQPGAGVGLPRVRRRAGDRRQYERGPARPAAGRRAAGPVAHRRSRARPDGAEPRCSRAGAAPCGSSWRAASAARRACSASWSPRSTSRRIGSRAPASPAIRPTSPSDPSSATSACLEFDRAAEAIAAGERAAEHAIAELQALVASS